MEKIKGRMAVYSKEHRLLDEKLYYTSAGMKRIMDGWMNTKVIPASYITVRPYVDNDDKVLYHLHIGNHKHEVDPKTFVRPPAEYDNVKNGFKY